jgi:hypothetical protein
MRLLFWSIAAFGGARTTAVMPRHIPPQEILVSEVTGEPGNLSVGEAGLPQSGGPELSLPVASMLLGMSILIYALLRQRRA